MTRIIVRKLVWKEVNTEHIKKHEVTPREVEFGVKNLSFHKKSYKGRYVLVGRSGKRILSIIVKRERMGKYFVVTARDANKKERRRLYEKEKNK